jgi:hypothetical protein
MLNLVFQEEAHERSAEIKSACAKVPGSVEDCDRARRYQQLQDWAIELAGEAEEVERRSEIVCSASRIDRLVPAVMSLYGR